MKKCQVVGLLFFVIVVLLGIDSSAYGQSRVYDRCGIIPGHGKFGSLPEENIDLFTGNVTLRYRDIYLPGPNGLDVEVWRVYNSKILKDRQSGNPIVQAYHQSWVGMGWTMHMGMVHNYLSSAPVIEFPDGRLETAYPNIYGLGSSIFLTRDFLKYNKTYYPPFTYPKLYFKNGNIWTFGASATINRADGTSDPVLLVTKIENPYGHSINIYYIAGTQYIESIKDSMGRTITFISGGTPRKLVQIRTEDAAGNDRIFFYSVDSWPANGYLRLDSFTPPMLAATTFEYNDGSSSQYELIRMTTSYGGVLEYSYENHTFYFNTAGLDSRVVSQKKINFNAGDEQTATWNFTYPSYNGVTTGTVQVDGPEYGQSISYNAFDVSNQWKIGLIHSLQKNDGSYSENYSWNYQQMSSADWYVLGVYMGKPKGPLSASLVETRIGDATSKTEYLYEVTESKRYGLPSTVKTYFGESSTLKNSISYQYYFEINSGFKNRYMLDYVRLESVISGQSQMMKQTLNTFFDEAGKWGALKQVQRWKGSGYFVWDYTYSCTQPEAVNISIDPPGDLAKQYSTYYYGVKETESMPDFTTLARTISPHDSSISAERRQDEGLILYGYDNLGRIDLIEVGTEGYYNEIDYQWQPNDENKVTISQDKSVITKFWDGMGRDVGYTETDADTGTVLYFLKSLDAEGRAITECKGSISQNHAYTYQYNAAGQLTSITNPLGKTTIITYCQNPRTKTMTDAKGRNTIYEYGDLPGLPTKITDALSHSAKYTYDAVGRLTSVVFNGTRNHSYTYDPLDNVLTETHPETGQITYEYNNKNKLWKKISQDGANIEFIYDSSGRLTITKSIGSWVYYEYSPFNGRLKSARDTWAGWSREDIMYNSYGKVTEEYVTIPGLPRKRISYKYDKNNNPIGNILEGTEFPAKGPGTIITNYGFNMPKTLSFKKEPLQETPDSLVNNVTYGPNKQPTAISLSGNGTAFSASYNNAGMLSSVSLTKGAATLYDASYEYDDVGNIHSITSTTPALTATFEYDALNRLTSASYSTGNVGTYTYQYDEYGNMLNILHDGSPYFGKQYDNKNRIINSPYYTYDQRGNLLTSNGNIYFWDAQNRLTYIQNTAGEVIGKYLYDDRGLRLRALPPLPEINVKHDDLDISDGGEIFLRANPRSSSNETLTIHNLGDANLNLDTITKSGENPGDFDVIQAPTSLVLPGNHTDFVIQFHPQTAGHKTAVLTIPCNDVDEGQYEINVFGNYDPEIDILQAPDGGSWDFEEIGIGYYVETIFTIRNLGEKELLLSGEPIVRIEGQDKYQFSVEQQPVSPVQGKGSTTFIIRFSPMSEGLKMATISIANNDWDENPYDITLYGTGGTGPMRLAKETAFTVTSPAEGEVIAPGSIDSITWTGAEAVKDLKIEYSTDNGSTFQTLVERTPNSGSYSWLVPNVVSGVCLIRVFDADGLAITPKTFSYEFMLKIPSEYTDPSKLPNLSLNVIAPDAMTQTTWAAELKLSADEAQKLEDVSLNMAMGTLGELEKILGRWHHVRVQLEFENYTASLCLNGRIVLNNIALRQSYGTMLPPALSMSVNSGLASSIRIEDLRVMYCDQTLRPEVEGEEVSQSIVKDIFEGYQTGEFPKEGGWIADVNKIIGFSSDIGIAGDTQESVQTVDTPVSAHIDETDRFSGLKSFTLKTPGESTISVAKSFSLPNRVPFGVTAGSFSIGVETVTSPESQSSAQNQENLETQSGEQTNIYAETGVSSSAILTEGMNNTDTSSPGRTPKSTKTLSALSTSRSGSYYLYSINGKLLRQYDVYGMILKDFIYMGNQLIAEYDHVGNRYLYYTQDQINSTRVVTDGTGNVVYSEAYNPYGGVQETWANAFDPLPKFSGKERDEESGLDYFLARYYDKTLYRFLSVDAKRPTIHNLERWNLYAYCGNNPVTHFDPNGNSYVVFYADRQQIELIDKKGNVVGRWNAANEVVSGKTEFPAGQWDRCWWVSPKGKPSANSSVGSYGGITFDIDAGNPKKVKDMMVHSGQEDKGSYLHPTNGCIRTIDEAMKTLFEVDQGRNGREKDKIEYILVIREDEKTQIVETPLPAARPLPSGLEPPGIGI